MIEQRIFKTGYVAELYNNVKKEDEETIARYAGNEFPFDKEQVDILAGIPMADENLGKNMVKAYNEGGEYAAAKLFYDHFKNLTPIIASMEELWAYLCHNRMFIPYVKTRWKVKGKITPQYIQDHYFTRKKGVHRNALAALWWGMHISRDEENTEDPQWLSETFFKNYTLRAISLSALLRENRCMLGILEFLKDHPEYHTDNRAKYLARHINFLATVRQLSFLSRKDIYAECEKIMPILDKITDRDSYNAVCAGTLG